MAHKSPSTAKWARRALQFFGVLHLAFGVVGLYYLLSGLLLAVTSGYLDRVYPSAPYHLQAFVARSSINLIFLVVLVIAGVFLLRVRRLGVLLSNVLFVAMSVYFAFDVPFAALFGEGFRRSIAATAGTGDVGIVFQMVTAYPIICLVALNLLNYKARRVNASPE